MTEESLIKILHVDDNESNRYIVSRILRNAGFIALEAETGYAGLQVVTEQSPDLVILDVKLPDLNGFEVCHQIKTNSKTAFIPVLHLSASFIESRDKAQGLDSGADAYLAQPVEPIELLATIRSLLRIRRAEDAALALAKEWQITFDSISDGVGLLDREGNFLRCNRALAQLLGRPVEDIIGYSQQTLIEKFLGYTDITPFARVQVTQQREIQEVQFDSRWFLVTVDPVFNSEDSFTGAVYLLTDITERQRAEAERIQLLNREQKARTEAEAANRVKDEFLATLSHELRSPLNAMLGWTRLLNTRKFDEATTARAMETIERNARSQAQLVEDLLDVSRIIQGKLRLNVRPIELKAIIETALETAGPAAEAKEIRLQSVLDPGSGCVAGDSDRLQQIIWNLLSNAIKFTPKGGRVQIRLERVHSHVEIAVSDTGQGISSDFVPYVFDRFRQADSSITRSYSGLGLGLAIVRHLVELHGGTVEAYSSGPGEGSTFTVKLPLIPVRIEESNTERIHPTVAQAVPFNNPPSLKGVRVLIVDDEVDARNYLLAVLEQCEAETLAATSAQEAIELLLAQKPDVLVSDIGMPEEDGYSLIHRIRALPVEQGGSIPAVALTAYARTEDRTRVIAAGFQIHIPKPVEPAELATVIASLAARNRKL
ncbi:response regulator [Trichocoleus sp. FACHB-591]|uniref:ATP-binding response regulator n=1 Tax=Trichocoleus sp. FACHB-591 TaxID=2692872 RepID=UPI001687594D|nr:response regulator [Trichocoleus sp. FACHB-591]MBD2093978.1 response regulator [Trichocoleus sp. FACHB-591]